MSMRIAQIHMVGFCVCPQPFRGYGGGVIYRDVIQRACAYLYWIFTQRSVDSMTPARRTPSLSLWKYAVCAGLVFSQAAFASYEKGAAGQAYLPE